VQPSADRLLNCFGYRLILPGGPVTLQTCMNYDHSEVGMTLNTYSQAAWSASLDEIRTRLQEVSVQLPTRLP
jgi:hypothetical protein